MLDLSESKQIVQVLLSFNNRLNVSQLLSYVELSYLLTYTNTNESSGTTIEISEIF